jgi:hypothetical protein
MNSKLGEHTKLEIRQAIGRCSNSREISSVAAQLAQENGVSKNAIYNLTVKERAAVVPPKKPRADKGKFKVDLTASEAGLTVLGFVLHNGLNTAQAVRQAEVDGLGLDVSFVTVDRQLRALGLDKRARRNPVTPHVRFEAKAPGDMFQADISGLKERWYDHATRRIVNVSSLDVSKNHANSKPTRVKIWRFVLIDDYSRRKFFRYYAVDKPRSKHFLDFLLHAYSEIGVPFVLYTDNDMIIKFGRNKAASDILDKSLADQGGYKLLHHLPGNSRASGKVERSHQAVEQDERFISLWLERRGALSIDVLNEQLARHSEDFQNTRIHRTTGEKPIDRWFGAQSVVRIVDYALLKSALDVDMVSPTLRGDLTITINKIIYQLPTKEVLENGRVNPFLQLATKKGVKLDIVFSDDHPFFTVVGVNGSEGVEGFDFDIDKQIWTPQAAGEFKALPERRAEIIRKQAGEAAKAHNKGFRAAAKADPSAAQAPIVMFDAPMVEAAEDVNNTVVQMPKRQTELTPERIASVAPERTGTVHLSKGAPYTYFAALKKYKARFASVAFCKDFLDSVFPEGARENAGVRVLEADIDAALALYQTPAAVEAPRLRAVS